MKTLRIKRVLLTGVCFLMAFSLSACGLFPQEEDVLAPPLVAPAEVTYTTISVSRDTITQSVKGTGNMVATRQHDVYFEKRSGYLEEINVKMGDTVKKGDVLAKLDTGTLEYDIRRQELIVQRAENYYKNLSAAEDYFTRESAKIDLELAQLSLESMKEELAKSVLYAPIDGRVTYLSSEKVGEYVQANRTFVRVADPNSLQLQYTGENVNSFVLGSRVILTFQKYTMTGEVVMTAANAPQDLLDSYRSVARMNVLDVPEDITLRIGDRISIELVIDQREDVLTVPRNAVQKHPTGYFVQVLDNGVKTERMIEIGLQDSTSYEVISGLEEGDMIILD